MSIDKKIQDIRKTLPENVKLVVVSKHQPISRIEEAYQTGERVFGENRVQELIDKYQILPKDIEWHMIGHLQTNKVKYVAPFVSLIHAVDSLKLLKEIDKQAKKNSRIIDCLLQFHIATENTKFGLSLVESEELLSSDDYKLLHNIRIVGVMGMATNTRNDNQVANEFSNLNNVFLSLKKKYFNSEESFKEISIGMSNDYHIAIENNSTIIRVGSKIFNNAI